MTEEEYYQDFMQDIYARSGAEENFCEVQFSEEMCDFLVEQAICELASAAPATVRVQHGNRPADQGSVTFYPRANRAQIGLVRTGTAPGLPTGSGTPLRGLPKTFPEKSISATG